MTRRCAITGKGPVTGNNVSKANNRTRRRFLPTLHKGSIMSEALGKAVRLRLSARAIRTIEHNGGLDAYLLKTADSKLSPEVRRIKTQIKKAQAAAS